MERSDPPGERALYVGGTAISKVGTHIVYLNDREGSNGTGPRTERVRRIEHEFGETPRGQNIRAQQSIVRTLDFIQSMMGIPCGFHVGSIHELTDALKGSLWMLHAER